MLPDQRAEKLFVASSVPQRGKYAKGAVQDHSLLAQTIFTQVGCGLTTATNRTDFLK